MSPPQLIVVMIILATLGFVLSCYCLFALPKLRGVRGAYRRMMKPRIRHLVQPVGNEFAPNGDNRTINERFDEDVPGDHSLKAIANRLFRACLDQGVILNKDDRPSVEDLHNLLRELNREDIGHPDVRIEIDSRFVSDLMFESTDLVALSIIVEELWDVTISDKEYEELHDVRSLMTLLVSKLNNQS